MAKTCPFFGKCGGCKFDFTAADYHEQKLKTLTSVRPTGDAIWVSPGMRRRADFAFAPGQFGFYQGATKNIVHITHCPNLVREINDILPDMASLPWCGSGSCLVTLCDNGIDIAITSSVPYFTPEFRAAVVRLPAIRITWNNRIIQETAQPLVSFAGHQVSYPTLAFLQPSISGADALRQMVTSRAAGFRRVADLFCGLGNFTFALGADGFDIVGTGVCRDLFRHPLTRGMLAQYDCVVMDPPRAGALAQCQELAVADVSRIIYVSCNPNTFARDCAVLEQGGYTLRELIPVDQFAGSHHWEIFSVFDKKSA